MSFITVIVAGFFTCRYDMCCPRT